MYELREFRSYRGCCFFRPFRYIAVLVVAVHKPKGCSRVRESIYWEIF